MSRWSFHPGYKPSLQPSQPSSPPLCPHLGSSSRLHGVLKVPIRTTWWCSWRPEVRIDTFRDPQKHRRGTPVS